MIRRSSFDIRRRSEPKTQNSTTSFPPIEPRSQSAASIQTKSSYWGKNDGLRGGGEGGKGNRESGGRESNFPRCFSSMSVNKKKNNVLPQRRSKSAAEITTRRFSHRGSNKDRHSWCGRTPLLDIRFSIAPPEEEGNGNEVVETSEYAETNRKVWEGWLFKHMGEDMRSYIEERFSPETLSSEGGGLNAVGEPTTRRLFKILDRDPRDPRIFAEV